jgi:peptidyl-prolyl cis-trans isomerase D
MGAAQAAAEKLKGGADFVDVAKDQGLSASDIDLGTVSRSEMADPVIADAAFKLEENKVSDPITGKLGSVVILRVTAIEPGNTPSFEEAKPEMEKKLLKERASGAIFDLHDKIEDELAGGSKLSEIADKLKLTYQAFDEVDRDGKKPDGSTISIPAQKDVLNAAFASDVGVDNDPVDAKDDGVVWFDVLGVVPSQLKPFDQVKSEVEKDWRDEETRNQVAKYTQGLVDSLAGGSKTLEDVAKELNVEVLTSDPLKRDGATVNVLPAAVQQAFALPEGGSGSAPSGIEDGRTLFKVEKVTPPAALDPGASGRLKQQLALLSGQDTIAEYFNALEDRYGVKVNRPALDKLIGTGEQQ